MVTTYYLDQQHLLFQLLSLKWVEQSLCYLRWCPFISKLSGLPIANNYRITSRNPFSQAAAANFNPRKFPVYRPPPGQPIRPPCFPPCSTTVPTNNQIVEPETKSGNTTRSNLRHPACEEYSQDGFRFLGNISNEIPNPFFPPHTLNHCFISLLPTLTPFEGSDFILEEIEAELSDTSYKSGIDDAKCDLEKDILLLEAILNSEPLSHFPNQANYFLGLIKELKEICEAKTDETSIDETSRGQASRTFEYLGESRSHKVAVPQAAIAGNSPISKGINPIFVPLNSNGRGLTPRPTQRR
ncbi:hypothetical protein Tco_0030949 [Tanacetum coccineum]